MKNFWIRITAMASWVTYLVYITYIWGNLDMSMPFVSLSYLGFHILAFVLFTIFAINNWTVLIPKPRLLGNTISYPKVATIIPTLGEPSQIVWRTVLSVVNQNYPQHLMKVIVSDDSHREEMKAMVQVLNSQTNAEVIYHTPPTRDSVHRKGEAKSGNLNSALEIILENTDIQFIETRDSDDLVGNPNFLRHAIGQLIFDRNLAYVQFNKTIPNESDDIFENKDHLFYRVGKLFKNGANAVFPCGSGLVWRRKALVEIGGFPSWNLVEDFHSGALALAKGWKGLYVPFPGAISQVPPMDLPNYYKQKGTWAMDSVRFLLWGEKSGLNLRQRLHFAESGLMYIFSSVTFLYALLIAWILITGSFPLLRGGIDSLIYQLVWALGLFIYFNSLSFIGNSKVSTLIENMRISLALGPLFLHMLVKVLFYGPNKKPRYIVTRKEVIPGAYISYISPQLLAILLLSTGIGFRVKEYVVTHGNSELVTTGWAVVFIFIYLKTIRLAFHGLFKRN